MEFGKRYEGFVEPKQGASPYITIDDPALIKKKNEMRTALREEYTKKLYNPYRHAAGVGGIPFDAMHIRYNAMTRTMHQYFRPGPRFLTGTIVFIFIPYGLLVYAQEKVNREREYKRRTGQVAHADREDKKLA